MKILRDKNKWAIAVVIMAIAMIQMPGSALNPVISAMSSAFPNVEISIIQTCVNFTSLMSVVTSLFSGKFVQSHSKKRLIQFGLVLEMIASLGGLTLNNNIVLIYLWTGLMGISKGCYVAPGSSLLLDYFVADEKNFLSGLQSTFRSGGSIILSFLGGLFASFTWNLGFLANYLNIVVLIIVTVFLPKDHGRSPQETKRLKMPKIIYYYSLIVLLFMMIYNVHNVNVSLFCTEHNLGGTSIAGIVTAIYMAGGCAMGLIFGKISKKFGEMLFPISFILIALCYVAIGFSNGLMEISILSFVAGSSVSLVLPECIYCISVSIPASLGASAMAIATSFASNIGVFISPTLFSSLSSFIGWENIAGRYFSAALLSGIIGTVLLLLYLIKIPRSRISIK